ncbi:adenosine deaminase [Candidatus Sumerlaeota bacterium]|nr:adenosine deaminase [Candidatus Sumerlaeota bacterium]
MPQRLTRELIHKLPKVELHCHLDGSVRVETILELARERKVRLPANDVEGLRAVLVQDNAANLVEYLKAFDVTLSVMQDYDALKRIAYELIADAAAENVVYIEVRYAPILHQRNGMRLTAIVDAVLDGLRQGEQDFGVKWGLIICAMRMSEPKYSLQMAELCVMYKHRGVVGFDLAGAEANYPASRHKEAFELTLKNNVNVTIHAGEAYGPESISQALHDCGAHRIGHAVRLKEDGDLLNYCCDHRIPLEINLTSNLQTGAVKDLRFHPLRMYYDFGLRCCICTDNRLMSGTTVTDELYKAHTELGFTLEEIKDMIVYGLKSTFQHHKEKVELLHRVLKELKDIHSDGSELVTGAAIADIPTEQFTKSHA